MKTTINDFRFQLSNYGHYKVTFESPVTGRRWSKLINNMRLIDATKNEDYPKQKDLETLKFLCKL